MYIYILYSIPYYNFFKYILMILIMCLVKWMIQSGIRIVCRFYNNDLAMSCSFFMIVMAIYLKTK